MDNVTPGDFYKTDHKIIYKGMLDLLTQGKSVDLVNLYEHLRGEGITATYLAKLEAHTAVGVQHHARMVKEKADLRRLIEFFQAKAHEGLNGLRDVRAFTEEVEKEFIDLLQKQGYRDTKSPMVSSILEDLKRDIEQNERQGRVGIPTGLSKLDSAIVGFCPTHLWLIGGYTSVGKSTFLAQLLIGAIKENLSISIFSVEDSRENKTLKLLANHSDLPPRRILEGDFLPFQKEAISEGEEFLRQAKLRVYDDVYTTQGIRLKAKKDKLQFGLDVIAIDFVQNLTGEGSLYERMSNAAGYLQALAKELNCTVVALSQVSNESIRTELEIIGLKGAGELAACADFILWLQRSKENKKALDCHIRKNRPFGITGTIELRFSDNWTRIKEV